MIKTVFINPPFFLSERYGKDLKNFGALSEPLGLAYLAAVLEKNGYPVTIIDAAILGLEPANIIKQLIQEKPDLIGLTILTPMYKIMQVLVRMIKLSLPNVKIVIGGSHATAMPEETLLDISEIDYICVGEGESTILDLAKSLEGNKKIEEVFGIWYRSKEKLIANKARSYINNLDEIPPPARHLLPMERYTLTASRTKGVAYCPTLIVARGCPYDCLYCSHPFGRGFRHHSVSRIVSEVEELLSWQNICQMNLEADTLTVNKSFLMGLCEGLIKAGINKKVQWTCESRIDTVDKEMLLIMKQAGCWQISYGVESGVQRLLDIICKNEKVESIEEVFRLTHEVGITTRGFFMLGLPTETKEESWQTINFAKKLDPFWAQFTLTMPYPGTPLFKFLKEQNEIRTLDWSSYNTWAGWAKKPLPYVPVGRSQKELQELQQKALLLYYLRPRIFLRFLKNINSGRTFLKYLLGLFVLTKKRMEFIFDSFFNKIFGILSGGKQ